MIYAVGGWSGTDGRIYLYNWTPQDPLVQRTVIHYPRVLITPRSITFTFLHNSQFMVIGGEDEIVRIHDLIDGHQVAILHHQSELPMVQ
jgi:hypothetical protein